MHHSQPYPSIRIGEGTTAVRKRRMTVRATRVFSPIVFVDCGAVFLLTAMAALGCIS